MIFIVFGIALLLTFGLFLVLGLCKVAAAAERRMPRPYHDGRQPRR